MAVDLNATATTAIKDVQTAIDNLNKLKGQAGADVEKIVEQIEVLQQKQVGLRALALGLVESSPDNQAALAAVTSTATNLKTEAGNITTVATALNTAQKVVDYATNLITALGPFLMS